jgi:glycerol kinase
LKPTFSILNRKDDIASALSQTFDLIIIGGGVTGCGIALDAFAAGTSSRSTKLIHGGLRYLKQLEIGLVRETGLERAIVHRLAPHLVHAEKMLLPIVEGGTFNKWTASLAISVYDLLAKVESADRKVSYNRENTLELEPLLRPDIVKGGIIYSEYRTDDARLTIEIIKKAVSLGTIALNYMALDNLSYDEHGKINGVNCLDHTDSKMYTFKTRSCVSAAGPWVDKIRDMDGSRTKKSLRLTKGVHIVLSKDKLPINQAVYFDVFDGRMLFAIPRGSTTYIGTTDTEYDGGPLDSVVCNYSDAKYIIDAINHMFPSSNVSIDDIQSTWAGLRPLIHEDGKSPSEVSRRDEIFVSDSGLISIAGGKLTGYRKMAQRVVYKVSSFLGVKIPKSRTKNISLTHNPFKDKIEVQSFIDNLSKTIGYERAWYMTTTYGKAANHILEAAIKHGHSLEINLVLAELDYTIDHESVFSPIDFFLRRSGRAYFNIGEVKSYKQQVISSMSFRFKWSIEDENYWSNAVDDMIEDITVLT